MTTREIAYAVNRNERSVQRWAKRAGDRLSSIADKVSSVQNTGKPADYDLDETCAIIEEGMGRSAAGIYRVNAHGAAEGSARIDRLEGLVERLLGAVVALIPSGAASPSPAGAPLLPPPEISPRQALKKVIEDWARAHGRDFHEAYSYLYREYCYRYRVDISRLAKARGLSVLDYAENEEILGQLLALAYFLYGQKRE